MMDIRVVRMRMGQRFVLVPMAMFKAGRHGIVVRVLVVLIVNMLVIVFGRLVEMLMHMVFRQMQPDTERHQCGSQDQRKRHWFTHQHGKQGAEKWGNRVVSARSCGAKMAQAQDKQRQTYTIGKQTNYEPAGQTC